MGEGPEDQPRDQPLDQSRNQPRDQPHRDDGLDLARTIARATAGSSARPARRRGGGADRAADQARARRNAARLGPQVSGAHPDDRDPQLLGSTLDRLVAQQGWELELRVRSVFARWGELVGDQVGDHTAPEEFAEGRLLVRADSTAWATQLRLLAPVVVRRLNDELGEGTVSVVDVQGPRLPGPRRGQRRTRDSKGPGDTYG